MRGADAKRKPVTWKVVIHDLWCPPGQQFRTGPGSSFVLAIYQYAVYCEHLKIYLRSKTPQRKLDGFCFLTTNK